MNSYLFNQILFSIPEAQKKNLAIPIIILFCIFCVAVYLSLFYLIKKRENQFKYFVLEVKKDPNSIARMDD